MDFEEKEFLFRDIIVTAHQLSKNMVKEQVIVKKGDWLVTHKDGVQKVVACEDFIKNYTLLEQKLYD